MVKFTKERRLKAVDGHFNPLQAYSLSLIALV